MAVGGVSTSMKACRSSQDHMLRWLFLVPSCKVRADVFYCVLHSPGEERYRVHDTANTSGGFLRDPPPCATMHARGGGGNGKRGEAGPKFLARTSPLGFVKAERIGVDDTARFWNKTT